MTDLRQAAQRALEAMRCATPTGKITLTDWYKSITALRAALAEPVQEPVYWEVRCNAHPKWMRVDERQFDEYVSHGWEGQKLYAAPPQRKPLTDEEIQAAWDSVDMRHPRGNETRIAFARAIERVHGIGEQQ